jgi:hypothetical protein
VSQVLPEPRKAHAFNNLGAALEWLRSAGGHPNAIASLKAQARQKLFEISPLKLVRCEIKIGFQYGTTPCPYAWMSCELVNGEVHAFLTWLPVSAPQPDEDLSAYVKQRY